MMSDAAVDFLNWRTPSDCRHRPIEPCNEETAEVGELPLLHPLAAENAVLFRDLYDCD